MKDNKKLLEATDQLAGQIQHIAKSIDVMVKNTNEIVDSNQSIEFIQLIKKASFLAE